MPNSSTVMQGYTYAKEVYGEVGVDVDKAMALADGIPVSMHSWQGDDLVGFDGTGTLTGGISAIGHYPGRARTPDQLRQDIDTALTLIPGQVKLNLHACHAEATDGLDRDAYTIKQFQNWVDWAKDRGLGLDFNPTFFSHPNSDGNFTLASTDPGVRGFWVEHGKRCREIGQEFGRRLGKTCVVNYWMPDGYKDIPVDTKAPRERMAESLDRIFSGEMEEGYVKESIESKLFGLGIESYTVASHEFSMGYAITRGKLYCLDAGHFHPTEKIADKISSTLLYTKGLLLHLSRGVRWDSDHVVIWDDALQDIANEVIHSGQRERIYIGQDYFDASINRIACWAIAMRNTRKALLHAALTPYEAMVQAEREGNYTARLALLEEAKALPFAPVWDYYCHKCNRPVGNTWLAKVQQYEKEVLANRENA